MKAILFVILNVSVCFLRESVGVDILIPGGFGGVERKNFPRLAIARHDPPLQHTFNFYPGYTRAKAISSRISDPIAEMFWPKKFVISGNTNVLMCFHLHM